MGWNRQGHKLRVWVQVGMTGLLLVAALVGCGRKDGAPTGGDQTLTAEQQFEQGNAAYQQGDLDRAAIAFQEALRLQPSHIGSLTNLGVVYYQLGRLDAAVTQFEAGLKVDPNDAQLHYLLGATRLQQNRYDDAESSFLRAQQLQPTLPEVYYGLGALYKLQGKRDQAIQAFERFLEVGPAQDPQASSEAERELRELRGQ